jgi:hypothetical protein
VPFNAEENERFPLKQVNKKQSRQIDASKCLICSKPHTNPAALVPTGYVFCYACIAEHVARVRTCPVTGVAVDEHTVSIRKLSL